MKQVLQGPGFQGQVDAQDLEYIGVQPDQTTDPI